MMESPPPGKLAPPLTAKMQHVHFIRSDGQGNLRENPCKSPTLRISGDLHSTASVFKGPMNFKKFAFSLDRAVRNDSGLKCVHGSMTKDGSIIPDRYSAGESNIPYEKAGEVFKLYTSSTP